MSHHPRWLGDHDEMCIDKNNLDIVWLWSRNRAIMYRDHIPSGNTSCFVEAKHAIHRNLRSFQSLPEL